VVARLTGGPPIEHTFFDDGRPRAAVSHACTRGLSPQEHDMTLSTSTTLSLLTPSGRLTLGNLLGALRPMVARLDGADDRAYYGLSDLHAMTTTPDPALLRSRTAEMATLLLAVGLDRATLFRQSRVPAHTELAYLLECTAHTGELNRMIQFKEKGRGVDSTRVSLYTYPVLMAADILLYRPEVVPVGDDQRQHVELTRDLAIRFNRTYGEVFTVPTVATPTAGARVMDLADPTRKMSKSADAAGSVFLLDPPDVIRRKVARAVTDSDTGPGAVRASRGDKPGVTNLLDILTACGGSAEGITTYGALKAAVTDAVVAELEPVRKAYAELAADPAYVTEVFERGAERCREVTAPVLAAARTAIGLA
jgi:tryptophanyl-tRNA synthetase